MLPQKIRRAIIPAAGYGLRLLPVTRAVPKELLPIAGKPMIQYAWEEAVASGIKEIAIVIHPEKEAIRKFFEVNVKLERLIKEKGWQDLSKELLALKRQAKISFFYQQERQGLGQAILSCRDFIKEEPFALLNPDNIYLGQEPCLSLLLKAWSSLRISIVLLGRIKKEETAKVGVAKVKPVGHQGLYLIQDLEEKPGPQRAFSLFGVWGRAVLEPDIITYLERTEPDNNGEIQLTDALKLWVREKPLYGLLCPFQRLDAGDWPGFYRANFVLRRISRVDKKISKDV